MACPSASRSRPVRSGRRGSAFRPAPAQGRLRPRRPARRRPRAWRASAPGRRGPGITWPVPSHHGQVTVVLEPPRLETTRPVPRQGGQGEALPPWRGSSSATIGRLRLPCSGARRRPLRPQPHRQPAPRQPAHRAAGLAVRPRAGARASSCASRTSTPAASRRGFEAEQLADLAALGLDWDGPVVRQSERTRAATPRRIERLRRRRPALPVLVHAGGDPRGRLGAARARCPRAPTRARACGLDGRRARRARAPRGRPPALRVRAGGERVAFERPPARGRRGRRRRLRRAPQRRRARLQPRGRRRRRRPGHRRGRARRRPPRHAPPRQLWLAARLGPARAAPRARPAHARRPTAPAWPSATAP